jgi:transcriptional regulator with XRE-family HTH domain
VRAKVYFPNLAKTRIARGYSQRDLKALLAYRSVSRYAQYETGDRKPSVVEALRIAKVLGTTVEYLFETD